MKSLPTFSARQILALLPLLTLVPVRAYGAAIGVISVSFATKRAVVTSYNPIVTNRSDESVTASESSSGREQIDLRIDQAGQSAQNSSTHMAGSATSNGSSVERAAKTARQSGSQVESPVATVPKTAHSSFNSEISLMADSAAKEINRAYSTSSVSSHVDSAQSSALDAKKRSDRTVQGSVTKRADLVVYSPYATDRIDVFLARAFTEQGFQYFRVSDFDNASCGQSPGIANGGEQQAAEKEEDISAFGVSRIEARRNAEFIGGQCGLGMLVETQAELSDALESLGGGKVVTATISVVLKTFESHPARILFGFSSVSAQGLGLTTADAEREALDKSLSLFSNEMKKYFENERHVKVALP